MTYVTLSYLLSWIFSDFLLALRLMMLIMVFIFYMPGMILFFLIKS